MTFLDKWDSASDREVVTGLGSQADRGLGQPERGALVAASRTAKVTFGAMARSSREAMHAEKVQEVPTFASLNNHRGYENGGYFYSALMPNSWAQLTRPTGPATFWASRRSFGRNG